MGMMNPRLTGNISRVGFGRAGQKKPLESRGLSLACLPLLDLVECGKRAFEFSIEEPHRIENFAEGRGCSCPVSLSKGEDAVVSQISHDSRVGNSIVERVA